MTDKQIIIDGCDVSGCEWYSSTYFKPCDGCKNTPDCHYKKWQRKEQECEKLKKIIDEAKNSKLDLKSFLVGEAIQNEYEQQLDQLKAENDELKKNYFTVIQQRNKAEKTLTDIKEIAENGKRFAERYMITGEQKANVLTYANAVLQKISDLEV